MENITSNKELLILIQKTLTGIDNNLVLEKAKGGDNPVFAIAYEKCRKGGHTPYFITIATLKKSGVFLDRNAYKRTNITETAAEALESFLKIINSN